MMHNSLLFILIHKKDAILDKMKNAERQIL